MKGLKKLGAVILALIMILSFAACGGETAEPAQEATTETEAVEVPKLTLTVAEAGTPTSEWGLAWQEFADYVEEASGGNMEVELFLSGALGGYSEELGMLAERSVDMICVFPPAAAFDLPAFCAMQLAFNSSDEAVDMAYYTAFEDPNSAPIYQEQLAKYNSQLLPCIICTGVDAYVSTVEANSWQDLFPLKLGLASESQYRRMGFTAPVVIDTTQWYENLRTGVCEVANMSAADVVSCKLYEVSKSLVMGNLYQTMGYFAINSDSWNEMTPEQQEIITAAAEHTQQWSIDWSTEQASQCVKLCEEAGMNVAYMTDEDCMNFMTPLFEYGYPEMIEGLGGATGTVKETATVCQAFLDYFERVDGITFNVDLSGYMQ